MIEAKVNDDTYSSLCEIYTTSTLHIYHAPTLSSAYLFDRRPTTVVPGCNLDASRNQKMTVYFTLLHLSGRQADLSTMVQGFSSWISKAVVQYDRKNGSNLKAGVSGIKRLVQIQKVRLTGQDE